MTTSKKKILKTTAESRRTSLEVAVEAMILRFVRDGGCSKNAASRIVETCDATLLKGQPAPSLQPWEYLGGGWRYKDFPNEAPTPSIRMPRPSRPAPPTPPFIPRREE